jgi:hypothetical protein
VASTAIFRAPLSSAAGTQAQLNCDYRFRKRKRISGIYGTRSFFALPKSKQQYSPENFSNIRNWMTAKQVAAPGEEFHLDENPPNDKAAPLPH